MSKFNMKPLKTQNVFEVEPDKIIDPFERKAVLAMQATGLYVQGDGAFEKTYKALQHASEVVAKPPTMTYEDVVFRNKIPADIEDGYFPGVRVLSTKPDIAVSEAEFYRAHRRIEGKLYRVIGELMFSGPYNSDETSPSKTLEAALAGIKDLHQHLGAEAFNAFRPYFTGLNGYPGASGLYSESIPIIDLLVHGGSNITDEERETMRENLDKGLYPNHNGHSALFRALLDTDESPIMLPQTLKQGLERQLNQFRGRHMSTVRKFVPQAMTGTAEGSGGVANVADYLKSKIVRNERRLQND